MPDRPAKWMRGARSGIWPGWAESTILQTWPQFSGMRVEIPLVRGGVTDTYTSPGHKQLMMSAWLNIRYLFDLCLWEAGSSSPHADGPSAGGGVRPREEEAAAGRGAFFVAPPPPPACGELRVGRPARARPANAPWSGYSRA